MTAEEADRPTEAEELSRGLNGLELISEHEANLENAVQICRHPGRLEIQSRTQEGSTCILRLVLGPEDPAIRSNIDWHDVEETLKVAEAKMPTESAASVRPLIYDSNVRADVEPGRFAVPRYRQLSHPSGSVSGSSASDVDGSLDKGPTGYEYWMPMTAKHIVEDPDRQSVLALADHDDNRIRHPSVEGWFAQPVLRLVNCGDESGTEYTFQSGLRLHMSTAPDDHLGAEAFARDWASHIQANMLWRLASSNLAQLATEKQEILRSAARHLGSLHLAAAHDVSLGEWNDADCGSSTAPSALLAPRSPHNLHELELLSGSSDEDGEFSHRSEIFSDQSETDDEHYDLSDPDSDTSQGTPTPGCKKKKRYSGTRLSARSAVHCPLRREKPIQINQCADERLTTQNQTVATDTGRHDTHQPATAAAELDVRGAEDRPHSQYTGAAKWIAGAFVTAATVTALGKLGSELARRWHGPTTSSY